MKTSIRTHSCGELRAAHAGQTVRLCGWVATIRDHGGVVFLDLRDRWGLTQAVFRPEAETLHKTASALKPESVVICEGIVRLRPEGLANPDRATGEVELEATALEIAGPAEPTPFVIAEDENPSPELRMKYRYLDLRRPGQLPRLLLRHRVAARCRQILDAEGFVEVETPVLTRSTPEGARDYIVPSRTNKGSFFALPQSPQLFKQLLMVSGIDRYYQLVKCYRDEDLRADRQPEFTQLDLEMAFVNEEDVLAVSESILTAVLKIVTDPPPATPLPRLPFDEAMRLYGSDKPDLRFGLEMQDVSDLAAGCGFRVFENALEAGGTVRALCVPGGSSLSRKRVDALEGVGKGAGLAGLVALKISPEGLQGGAAKRFREGIGPALTARLGGSPGDLLLFAAGPPDRVAPGLGEVRLRVGEEMNLRKERFAALWIVEPPLFTRNPDTGAPDPSHHPFTLPRESDLPTLEGDPFAAKARAYDLVLNGHEIAGGSVRIHRRDIQARIFSLLGIPPGVAEAKFGFLLEAFRFGAPPHAGIAFGFDRLVALLAGLDQIREVIAFPKTTSAACPLTGAPAPVDEGQLKSLGIQLRTEH
ncbi:MAG: aspartate--tRNA ligase [Planctomycetota bacterium]|jgi:aspartyl-tRNA synthetase